MADKVEYGLLSYDCPSTKRSAYNRISRIIRGNSIMMSWSCYLVNWGVKDILQNALAEEAQKTPGLIYGFHKFDPSEEKALTQLAQQKFREMISKNKKILMEKIAEVKNGASLDIGHAAIGRALKKIQEAEQVAFTFVMGDSVAHGLAAFKNLIDAQADLLKGIDDGKDPDEVLDEILNQVEESVKEDEKELATTNA